MIMTTTKQCCRWSRYQPETTRFLLAGIPVRSLPLGIPSKASAPSLLLLQPTSSRKGTIMRTTNEFVIIAVIVVPRCRHHLLLAVFKQHPVKRDIDCWIITFIRPCAVKCGRKTARYGLRQQPPLGISPSPIRSEMCHGNCERRFMTSFRHPTYILTDDVLIISVCVCISLCLSMSLYVSL